MQAYAQNVVEESIPCPVGTPIEVNISRGSLNAINCLGVADTLIAQTFENETHKRVLFFATLHGTSLPAGVSILDTSICYTGPWYAQVDEFSCTVAQDSTDRVAVAWAKQRGYWSDIAYPQMFGKPVLRCASKRGGTFQQDLEIEGADHPNVRYDSHGVLHLAYESVSFYRFAPIVQSWYDTTYYFVTSKLRYSVIHPDGRIDSVETFPGGFRPQIQIDRAGNRHLFWLSADSSNSPTFRLMYARNPGSTDECVMMVYAGVHARDVSVYSRRPPEFVSFVDDSGRAYVGWTNMEIYENGTFFFARCLSGVQWTVDSLAALSIWGMPASFLVTASGSAHVLWGTSDYDSGWTLHHSYCDPTSHLFQQQRAFQSPNSYFGAQVIVADSRGIANSVFDDGLAGVGYLRDLTSGADTLFHIKPGYSIAYSVRGLPESGTQRSCVLLDGMDQLWIVGDNKGLSLLKVDRSVTAINNDGTSKHTPAQVSLAQNYPNPFNPKTTVTYQLPAAGVVRLVVYDLLGREVAVLVSEKQESGRHTVTWDASGMTSGVYFIRMQVGGYMETKKVVLAK